MTLYLKWCRKGRIPSYQGGDPIPHRRWTPTVTDPVLCERGWHACRWEDVVHHISDELWVCELAGTVVADADKVAAERLRLVRRVKLDDRVLRLFAADCAEQVLPLFEERSPNDRRPRKAIAAARAFANGEITRKELDAAWAAAWDAAGDAAGDAAWDAAAAAAGAARDAAWDAAGDAAGAARAAAGDAAWDAAAAGAARAAARAWQTDRLLAHYAGLDPADFAHKETL